MLSRSANRRAGRYCSFVKVSYRAFRPGAIAYLREIPTLDQGIIASNTLSDLDSASARRSTLSEVLAQGLEDLQVRVRGPVVSGVCAEDVHVLVGLATRIRCAGNASRSSQGRDLARRWYSGGHSPASFMSEGFCSSG